jgi:hypothetical protein
LGLLIGLIGFVGNLTVVTLLLTLLLLLLYQAGLKRRRRKCRWWRSRAVLPCACARVLEQVERGLGRACASCAWRASRGDRCIWLDVSLSMCMAGKSAWDALVGGGGHRGSRQAGCYRWLSGVILLVVGVHGAEGVAGKSDVEGVDMVTTRLLATSAQVS